MSIDAFLGKIRQGGRVSFNETLEFITAHFIYTPVRFFNGLGDNPVENPPGINEGSCKIFSFGKQYGLTKDETLGLFGELYWDEVLQHPSGEDHANIRTFLRDGWAGIRFEGNALKPRNE